VRNFVLNNDPPTRSHFLPFLNAILHRKRSSSQLWWKELKQHVQWHFVKSTIWHTTLEMRPRKFMGYYIMNFEAFNNLVKELTPFFQSQCVNLVLSQVKIRKIVTIVIYRLVHGTNATHMANQFNVRGINCKEICGHSV
jgi:Zn-dependent M32 family carboxypeptidase